MKVEIKINGRLGKDWEAWFSNMNISYEGNITMMSGEIVDESALHGILNQIRDLNLKLISAKILEQ